MLLIIKKNDNDDDDENDNDRCLTYSVKLNAFLGLELATVIWHLSSHGFSYPQNRLP